MSKDWYKAEAFNRSEYEREIEKSLILHELRELMDEKREINRKLKEVRKNPYWEDRIPYISQLNKRKREIERLIDIGLEKIEI